jgi:CelD/BcsL family acetyltransferase involved in cellulose biosynthesis
MTQWHRQQVPIKFQISDITLFSVALAMQVRSVHLGDTEVPSDASQPPSSRPESGTDGYYIHAMPISCELPETSEVGDYIRYVPLQYGHCYIDLSMGFEAYQGKFSSKTRSTIQRKVRKFAEHSGGTIRWRTYRTADELRGFHQLARELSRSTYQERLLDAGIPEGPEFVEEMLTLAARDAARGYLLFDGDQAVAYLYCPIQNDALIYAYLGYAPSHFKHSVGTVLQWLAIEQMFGEGKVRFFDFTEGQSEHKRLFSTHELRCANVMFVRRSFKTVLLLRAHVGMNRTVEWFGDLTERLGLKTRLRRLLRAAG